MVVRATTSAPSSSAKLAVAARRRGRRRRKLWCQKSGQRLAWQLGQRDIGEEAQYPLRHTEAGLAQGTGSDAGRVRGVNGEMMESYLRANLLGNVDRL